ncbi:MAG: hypothetical protein AAGH79_13990 [Bacteroidota bacterium]
MLRWTIILSLLLATQHAKGQCAESQIDLLEIQLLPAFQKQVVLAISCTGEEFILQVKDLYDYPYSETLYQRVISAKELSYLEQNLFSLDIFNLTSDENIYLLDGLIIEISLIDRSGRLARFKIHAPTKSVKHKYLLHQLFNYLIELKTSSFLKSYLQEIKDWYIL